MQAVGRDRAVEQMVWRARMRGAWLAIWIAERAHHVFLEPRRRAVSRYHVAGYLAPWVVSEWPGRRRSNERIARHGTGLGGAATAKGTAGKQTVSGKRLRSSPF